jgi:hypothetical protein
MRVTSPDSSLLPLRALIFTTLSSGISVASPGCGPVLLEGQEDGAGATSDDTATGAQQPPRATAEGTSGDTASRASDEAESTTSNGDDDPTTGGGKESDGTTGEACTHYDSIGEPLSPEEVEALGCELPPPAFFCNEFRWVCGPLAEGAHSCDDCDGPCFDRPQSCWDWRPAVICGPFVEAGECCYVFDYGFPCGDGRPFRVDDRERRAPLLEAGRWNHPVAPLMHRLTPLEREALARAWSDAGLAEHASVASFARLVLQLMAAGAPAELVKRTLAAMDDEIEHARLCLGLASAHAGRALAPGPLAVDGALSNTRDLLAIATATVIEGCVGETLAAALAAVARDTAGDPATRRVLDRIAGDEARHAALSFEIVRWCIRSGGDPVRAAVHDAFAVALRSLDPGREPIDTQIDSAYARENGRLPVAERRHVIDRCVELVIVPAATALVSIVGDGDRGRHP